MTEVANDRVVVELLCFVNQWLMLLLSSFLRL